MTLPTDTTLLTQVAEVGDRAALGHLVARHQDAVFRYCRSLCRDTASAEDALQQTFLDLMQGAGSFKGQSSFRSWLFTLARNAVHRGARLRAGEPRAHVPLDKLGVLAGWGEDPEQATARHLDQRRLNLALETLPPHSQEVLILRDLEGLSGHEVAELLHITLSAQKSRLHRARLELAAELRQSQSPRSEPHRSAEGAHHGQ